MKIILFFSYFSYKYNFKDLDEKVAAEIMTEYNAMYMHGYICIDAIFSKFFMQFLVLFFSRINSKYF